MPTWDDDRLRALFPAPSIAPPSPSGAPRWLVDGEVRVFEGPSREVFSRIPATIGDRLEPTRLGREALLGPEEVTLAVDVAARAFRGGEGEWPSASVERRSAAVENFARALEAQRDAIAELLMWEIGKPRRAARDEVTRSVEYMRATVVELGRLRVSDVETQRASAGGAPHFARTHRRPLGIVVCVAPFNYPVNEFLTTIIPALLMGNVVIAKTPRFGVLANEKLFASFCECFPAGTVAILPGEGRETLPALMRAGRLDQAGNTEGHVSALAFIGSEGAANAILRAHPTPITLHKVLGLGAKNAAIVMDSADLERAAAAVVRGALGFNGQRCTAEKIVFVQRAASERFIARVVSLVEKLKVGMPWDEEVSITPLPEPNKLEKMAELLDDALAKGAAVLNDGGGRGLFSLTRPAVVSPVTEGMRLFHEEQFGPILPISIFDHLDEVLEWHRRSPFGQQAAVWGAPAEIQPLARRLTRFVSRVNVNDVCQRGPDAFGFTATDKSGFGALSLRDALLTFSRPVLMQATDEASLDALRRQDHRS